jgi:hypothetical protein
MGYASHGVWKNPFLPVGDGGYDSSLVITGSNDLVLLG